MLMDGDDITWGIKDWIRSIRGWSIKPSCSPKWAFLASIGVPRRSMSGNASILQSSYCSHSTSLENESTVCSGSPKINEVRVSIFLSLVLMQFFRTFWITLSTLDPGIRSISLRGPGSMVWMPSSSSTIVPESCSYDTLSRKRSLMRSGRIYNESLPSKPFHYSRMEVAHKVSVLNVGSSTATSFTIPDSLKYRIS